MDCFFCNRNGIVYFDSFGDEHVPKEIKEFVGNNNKKANTSVMCHYLYIGFIDFMLVGKKVTILLVYFLPMILIKITIWFWVILKIMEIDNTNLSDQ